MQNHPHKSIVVGIGNPFLKDDRVGIEVVKTLVTQGLKAQTAIFEAADFDLLEAILGYESAVIVVACQAGMAPGTVLEIAPDEFFDLKSRDYSHAARLSHALQTGQMLFPDQMPQDLKLILVEVEDISSFSTKCTPVVCHAIGDVVDRIQATTNTSQMQLS